MSMNNPDPSMAQPTLPIWAAGPCVHTHIPTRPCSQLPQHTSCDANSGQGPGLGPGVTERNQESPPPSQSSQDRKDPLGDKSDGNLGSTARTIACGRSKVIFWPSAALPRPHQGDCVQLWTPH